MNDDELRDLAAQFDYEHDLDNIPSEIVEVMEYIDENTGLLGDYNQGLVRLVRAGRKIQWYPRSTYFSSHDNLLQWVQMEADDVMLGTVGTRTHPETDETVGYIQISPTFLWGYDDE